MLKLIKHVRFRVGFLGRAFYISCRVWLETSSFIWFCKERVVVSLWFWMELTLALRFLYGACVFRFGWNLSNSLFAMSMWPSPFLWNCQHFCTLSLWFFDGTYVFNHFEWGLHFPFDSLRFRNFALIWSWERLFIKLHKTPPKIHMFTPTLYECHHDNLYFRKIRTHLI